jgi:hypothetical protein
MCNLYDTAKNFYVRAKNFYVRLVDFVLYNIPQTYLDIDIRPNSTNTCHKQAVSFSLVYTELNSLLRISF